MPENAQNAPKKTYAPPLVCTTNGGVSEPMMKLFLFESVHWKWNPKDFLPTASLNKCLKLLPLGVNLIGRYLMVLPKVQVPKMLRKLACKIWGTLHWAMQPHDAIPNHERRGKQWQLSQRVTTSLEHGEPHRYGHGKTAIEVKMAESKHQLPVIRWERFGSRKEVSGLIRR